MSIAAQEKGGRLDELALLAEVDREGSRGKTIGFPVSNFDKYQAVAVMHDEVNFTNAAAIIPRNQKQFLREQIIQGYLLRLFAYRS